jgi:hypothetical protein
MMDDLMIGSATASGSAAARALEHFQEKWNPVFRPKMGQTQK